MSEDRIPHTRRICVLLPADRWHGSIDLIWSLWLDRQGCTLKVDMGRRYAEGRYARTQENWTAFACNDVQRIRGTAFDELVIPCPYVDHELLVEAQHHLR